MNEEKDKFSFDGKEPVEFNQNKIVLNHNDNTIIQSNFNNDY